MFVLPVKTHFNYIQLEKGGVLRKKMFHRSFQRSHWQMLKEFASR